MDLEELKKHGLLPRYIIKKGNGEEVSPSAKYFVLRYDKDGSDKVHTAACRKALRVYANEIKYHLPELSKELIETLDFIEFNN